MAEMEARRELVWQIGLHAAAIKKRAAPADQIEVAFAAGLAVGVAAIWVEGAQAYADFLKADGLMDADAEIEIMAKLVEAFESPGASSVTH